MEISGNAFVSGLNAVQSGSACVAQAGARSPAHGQLVRPRPRMVELTRGKLEAQSGARYGGNRRPPPLIDTHA